jgi:hypothetical protein
MTFQPGIVSNPNGRPKGSKNKLALDFQKAVEAADQKYPHPYLMMAEWANDESKPLEVRAAMLKECASYRCVKPKQTIGIESTVPVFQTEQQAEAFLAEFISAMAPDLEPEQIAAMTRQWVMCKREGRELELKAANQGDPNKPMLIRIKGGLPVQPGHEGVIMPHQMNGHGQGPVIEHQKTPEMTPGQAKDPEP